MESRLNSKCESLTHKLPHKVSGSCRVGDKRVMGGEWGGGGPWDPTACGPLVARKVKEGGERGQSNAPAIHSDTPACLFIHCDLP